MDGPGQEDLRVLVANVEMSPHDLLNRELARKSGVGHNFIRYRDFDEGARGRVEDAIEAMRKLQPRLEFMAGPFTVERLVSQVTMSAPDIVVVDYVQRFSSEGGNSDARQQAK